MRAIISSSALLAEMRLRLLRCTTFAFDTETDNAKGNGLAHDRFAVCYSIACDSGAWVVPLKHASQRTLFAPHIPNAPQHTLFAPHIPNAPQQEAWGIVREIFSDENNTVYIHNAKFDLHVLRNEGIDPQEIRAKIIDTQVMSWLINPEGEHGLKPLVKNYLDYEMRELAPYLAKYKRVSHIPVPTLAPYAIDDVAQLLRLAPLLEAELATRGAGAQKVFYELENTLPFLIEEMEHTGFRIDAPALASARVSLLEDKAEIESYFFDLLKTKPNLSSPAWLSAVFCDERKVWSLPPGKERTKTGCVSTDKESLKEWASGKNATLEGAVIAQRVLDFRTTDTLISRYTTSLTDLLDDALRIHGSFNQCGTATGRWSSSNPNLQNISKPKKGKPSIRDAFIAREGFVILDADYSQIELRLLAHFSKDPNMLRIFLENGDIHQLTADLCGCSRDDAKTINFAIIYGMGAVQLAAKLKTTVAKAREFMRRYKHRFAAIADLRARVLHFARLDGYVSTIIGRRRYVPEIKSNDGGARAYSERIAFNAIIQGSAADLIKLAVRNIQRRMKNEGWFRTHAFLLSQVHDELIFEVESSRAKQFHALVCEEMTSVVKLRVPLRVDARIAESWGKAK